MNKVSKRKFKEYSFVFSIFLYPAVLFLIFYVFVNFKSIIMAFQGVDTVGNIVFVGFANFSRVFKNIFGADKILYISMLHSVINCATVFIIIIPLSVIFSFYLYKKFFAHNIVRIVALMPSIISSFILCLLVKKFLEEGVPTLAANLGFKHFPKLLTDDRYAYITTIIYSLWLGITGNLIIIPNAMNQISESIIESAELSGANLLQEFWHIVLPLIYPTLSTFMITSFASLFTNAGSLIDFFMFDAPESTYNLGYYLTQQTMINSEPLKSALTYPYLSAMGIVITIISAPLTFLVKYLFDKFDPMEA